MMRRIDCGEDFNGTSTKSGERRVMPDAPELYALRPRRTANRERATKEEKPRKGGTIQISTSHVHSLALRGRYSV